MRLRNGSAYAFSGGSSGYNEIYLVPLEHDKSISLGFTFLLAFLCGEIKRKEEL